MTDMSFCPHCFEKISQSSNLCPKCGKDTRVENESYQLPLFTILHGRYLIGKALGAGGFGITYAGFDLKLQCRVAIKEYFLSGQASRTHSLTVVPNDEQTTAFFEKGKLRFLDEARVLAQFAEEPSIVQVRDYFEENATGYIIMEFLQGQDLSTLLKKEGAMPYERVLELLEPAMLALDRVHQKGLIHRDISPANLMLLDDGTVKLLDFGTARSQSLLGQNSLSIMLKPGFAPEEQYRRHGEQGPWTDVYAMSATFYKLLTGQTPPPATDRAFADKLDPPSRLGAAITPAQEQALLRGLALRPKDRIQTVKELAQCLKGEKKLRPRLPKKALIAAAAALVLLGGGLGIGSLLSHRAAPVQEAPQETAAAQESEQPEEERQGRWVLGEENVVIKKTLIRADGSIHEVTTSDYDEYGRRIYFQTETWENWALSSHFVYANRIEYTEPDPDSPAWRQTAHVFIDDDGNESRTEYRLEYREEEGAEVNCRYEDGVLQGWTVEEEGNSAEGNYTYTFYHYYPDGSLSSYTFIEHFPQEDGTTLAKQQQFDAQGKLTYRSETLYNENWDQLFSQSFSNSTGSEQLTKEESCEYDENGKALSGTVTEYYSGDPETFTVSFEHETRQIYQWEWDDE